MYIHYYYNLRKRETDFPEGSYPSTDRTIKALAFMPALLFHASVYF